MIYGSSLGAFAEESQEHKMLNRKLKNKKRTAEMVEEVWREERECTFKKRQARFANPSFQVGGKRVWDSLEWKLWRNIS